MSVISGQNAESEARLFLEKNGLHFLEKNYRCPLGEIDLIMRDPHFHIFVEVRMRKNPEHGNSAETVTKAKQRRVLRSALHYLQKKALVDRVDCRFDVLAIDDGKIEWIKNAFEA